jgi:hypothetical protein
MTATRSPTPRGVKTNHKVSRDEFDPPASNRTPVVLTARFGLPADPVAGCVELTRIELPQDAEQRAMPLS